jgi:hydroxymethylpyrimidine/phosphomethylpyrimidine kinase
MTARLLLVGGLDPTGAAGLLADLRAAKAAGVGAGSVVTADTHQDDQGVWAVRPSGPEAVAEAIRQAVPVTRAVKTGLLPGVDTIRAIADSLPAHLPLVVDPVLAATSGGVFLDADGIEVLMELLVPQATMVVPNRDEAALLTGIEGDPVRAGEALLSAGASAVVVTGGNGPGGTARDWYVDVRGAQALDRPRTPHGARGTGCAFATALGAWLARGAEPRAAAEAAKQLVHKALVECSARGQGRLWADLAATGDG